MIKSIKKLFSNLINSLNGLRVVLKEHSFILEIIGGIALIPFVIIAEIEIINKILITSVYFILLAFELLNTDFDFHLVGQADKTRAREKVYTAAINAIYELRENSPAFFDNRPCTVNPARRVTFA